MQGSFPSTASTELQAGHRTELIDTLVDRGLKLGEGVDASGRRSGWTLDCREVLLMSRPLTLAARLLWERLRPYNPDVIGGMTLSADPLIVALLYEAILDGHELSGFLVRRAPKAAGLRKQVEGPPLRPGARVALVDDLINSGGTLNRTLAALEPYDPRVVAIAVLVDFESAGSRVLREEAVVPFEPLFTLRELGIRPSAAIYVGEEPEWTWSAASLGPDEKPGAVPAIKGAWTYAWVGREQVAARQDGTERWRFRSRGPGLGVQLSTPVVHDGTVYVAAPDGYVYALSAHSGCLQWETSLGFCVAPQTIDTEHGLLLVAGGAREPALAALRTEDGFATWCTKTGATVRCACLDPSRRQVILGIESGTIAAYDSVTGRRRWSTRTGGAVRCAPAIDGDGRCYAGSRDGLLYALDADSGRQVWTRRLGRFVDSSPLVVDDVVVAGGPTHLVALDRATGTIRWVAPTGGTVSGAVAVGPSALVAGSTDGGVYVVDRRSGAVRSRYPTGSAIRGRPIIHGERCTIASGDGTLYGFRIGDAWPVRPPVREAFS